ncbi:hypothetical protein Pint_36097 [Pistacia integerrima]|uniref:Uncharacterized protein n=1 Tax=Pistacia integerrima TaxID=434235 RepID=A0ACC0Y4V5_9ROSI|nr:hypothetical protein Pint_36097 [Pistacia integerrima]
MRLMKEEDFDFAFIVMRSWLGHRCKRLFAIQVILEPEDEDVDMDLESPTYPKMPTISLHAMAGMLHANPKRICGRIKRKTVLVLLDSGSSNNFINEIFASCIGLQPLTQGKLEVMVASRERILHRPGNTMASDSRACYLGLFKNDNEVLPLWKGSYFGGSLTPEDGVVDNFMIEKVT